MGLILDFIVDFIVNCVGVTRGEAWISRRGRESGKIQCGLRVIAGTQGGLKGGWNKSRAFVHPGRLEFGRRTPISVRVREVVTDRQRRPHGRELLWQLTGDNQIVVLMSDSATLEWALPDDGFEWALERVRGSEATSA